jgi:two-component system sensor histidine kinase KdpD
MIESLRNLYAHRAVFRTRIALMDVRQPPTAGDSLARNFKARTSPRWTAYVWAVGATAASTLAGFAMRGRFDLVNIAMVYLLAVVLVALRHARGPAILTSILCITAFDVLFVPPQGTFTVDDLQYVFTFAIMLTVGLVISYLVADLRRQAREQAALEIAAETERIRSALLASISHDLRTPLAVMSGASSTLVEAADKLSAQERRALASSIFEQSRDMAERVTKVLQMTRLETGAIQIDRDWTSIREIASSALARMSERLASHRLIVELPDDLPLVKVDAALVEQALGNLLENAAKHTPAGTVVRLNAKQRANDLVVSVVDYSGGPSEVDVERIFQKFAHGPLETTTGGVGLGLAICRAIVRLHGGDAWAERVASGGMAFRFSLPIEQAPGVGEDLPGADDGLTPDDPHR